MLILMGLVCKLAAYCFFTACGNDGSSSVNTDPAEEFVDDER